MKILKVQIRNLNSIKGDWTIDFRSPEFVQSGLFVITGPTGSGKTTILDAICLALYGQTPRLGVVGTAGNGNEVMTKGCRECLASVEFKTSAGKHFLASWSQEMSRVGAKNPYRQYLHKVVDLDTGNALTTTPAEGADRVEKLTGLSFERFRQSVMLAQNSFADFLMAKEHDRATMLEQITGTGIYTQISTKVHELQRSASNDVNLVKARLEGISILDDAQSERFKTRLDELNGELRPNHHEKDRLDQAIGWLKRIRELQEQANNLQGEQQELERQKTEFEPKRLVLRQALQALAIDADWRLVDERRKALDGATVDLKVLLDAVTGLRDIVGQATVARDTSEVAFRKAQEDRAQAIPRINKARQLDTSIEQNRRRLNADSQQLDNKKKAHANLADQNAEAVRQQADRAELLKTISDSISRNQGDQGLESGLPLVRDRLERFSKLSESLDGVKSDLQLATSQEALHTADLEKARARLNRAETAEKQARDSRDRIAADLAGVLDGHDVGWWTERLASLTHLGSDLAAALETIHAINQRRAGIKEIDQSDLQMNRAIDELSDAIGAQDRIDKALADKLDLLRERQRFSGQVADLEKIRATLKTGHPCPLCGSLDHPFKLDGLPPPDETADAIKSTEAERIQVASSLKTLTEKLGKARGELQANKTQRDRITREVSDLGERLVAAGQKCGFDGSDVDVETAVAGRVRENELALDACRKVTNDVARLQESATPAQRALDLAATELSDANVAVEKGLALHAAAAESVVRLDKQRVDTERQLDQDRAGLQNDVAVWGVTAQMLDDAAAVLKSLEDRRGQWREWTADATRLEKEMSAAGAEIGQREKQLLHGKAEIDELSGKLESLQKEMAALAEQRRLELGDHDPDQFMRSLEDAVEKARVDLKKAEEALQAANANLNSNGRQQNETQARIDRASKDLAGAEAAFDIALTGREFASREAFFAARRDETQLTDLQHEQESLDNAQNKLTGRIQQNQSMLGEENAKALTDRPLQELLDQAALVQKKIDDLNQEMGGIRAGLDADRTARESRAAEVRQLERLQQVLADWTLLDKMIGSGDGKVYRVFVQIITFRALVRLANQHLKTMNTRYELFVGKDKEGKSCLNLDVKDTWRGGELRPVTNLSGGETFIVSLALALGLAGLASQHIRIDSLFMDEGFGSLDEESLNMAVNTLADIQAHGKLIGVISHVEALKTAIPVRIDVKRVSGGVSVLDGPGVTRQA